MVDAIMVGKNTLEIDRPRLDCRFWPGKAPRRVEAEHDLQTLMKRLYAEGITSLMVEGGPTLLKSFIEQGLYDDVKIEVSPMKLGSGLPAPETPELAHPDHK